jgi:DNA-binding LacI/PurR family transcriptional regulator
MATISDVARRAGVAPTTVSHALSGKRHVAPATRARILAAVEELQYQPNATASSLRSRRTRTVALSLPLDVPGRTLAHAHLWSRGGTPCVIAHVGFHSPSPRVG